MTPLVETRDGRMAVRRPTGTRILLWSLGGAAGVAAWWWVYARLA